MSVTVFLGLGANMGDRKANLDRAIELLAARLDNLACSSVYETEPVGLPQPKFLNMVCRAETGLAPLALLTLLKGIEHRLGRNGASGAPRPIDIDILFYGDRIIDTPRLVTPHPRLAERAFVLAPLAELAPGLKHPVSGRSAAEMLAQAGGREGVVRCQS